MLFRLLETNVFWNLSSARVRESKTVLDSEFHAMDSAFLELYSGFQRPGSPDSTTKIWWILDSTSDVACVAWRFWLGELSNKGGRGQRKREEAAPAPGSTKPPCYAGYKWRGMTTWYYMNSKFLVIPSSVIIFLLSKKINKCACPRFGEHYLKITRHPIFSCKRRQLRHKAG